MTHVQYLTPLIVYVWGFLQHFPFYNTDFFYLSSIKMITCLAHWLLVLYTVWCISASMHGCFVNAAWLPRLLRQHNVVLRVHCGPWWSHSAGSHSHRFSSSLTRIDMALWSHEEQCGPGTSPTKAILSSTDVSKHASGPPNNGLGQQGPPLQLLCIPMNEPRHLFTCERRCCFVTTKKQIIVCVS